MQSLVHIGRQQHCFTFAQHFKVKCNFCTQFFARCWWPRESVIQGSSVLSEFRTSLSKVLTLCHCVKVKQHNHIHNYCTIFYIFQNTVGYHTAFKISSSRQHEHILRLLDFSSHTHFTVLIIRVWQFGPQKSAGTKKNLR